MKTSNLLLFITIASLTSLVPAFTPFPFGDALLQYELPETPCHDATSWSDHASCLAQLFKPTRGRSSPYPEGFDLDSPNCWPSAVSLTIHAVSLLVMIAVVVRYNVMSELKKIERDKLSELSNTSLAKAQRLERNIDELTTTSAQQQDTITSLARQLEEARARLSQAEEDTRAAVFVAKRLQEDSESRDSAMHALTSRLTTAEASLHAEREESARVKRNAESTHARQQSAIQSFTSRLQNTEAELANSKAIVLEQAASLDEAKATQHRQDSVIHTLTHQVEDTAQTIERHKSTINSLTLQVEEANEELESSEDALQTKRDRIRDLEEDLEAAQLDTAVQEAEINSLTAQVDDLKLGLAKSKEDLRILRTDGKATSDQQSCAINDLTSLLSQSEASLHAEREESARVKHNAETIQHSLTSRLENAEVELNVAIQEHVATRHQQDCMVQSLTSQVEDAAQTNERHKSTITSLTAQIDEANAELEESEDALQTKRDRIRDLEEDLEAAQLDTAVQEAEINSLIAQVEDLEIRLGKSNGDLLNAETASKLQTCQINDLASRLEDALARQSQSEHEKAAAVSETIRLQTLLHESAVARQSHESMKIKLSAEVECIRVELKNSEAALHVCQEEATATASQQQTAIDSLTTQLDNTAAELGQSREVYTSLLLQIEKLQVEFDNVSSVADHRHDFICELTEEVESLETRLGMTRAETSDLRTQIRGVWSLFKGTRQKQDAEIAALKHRVVEVEESNQEYNLQKQELSRRNEGMATEIGQVVLTNNNIASRLRYVSSSTVDLAARYGNLLAENRSKGHTISGCIKQISDLKLELSICTSNAASTTDKLSASNKEKEQLGHDVECLTAKCGSLEVILAQTNAAKDEADESLEQARSNMKYLEAAFNTVQSSSTRLGESLEKTRMQRTLLQTKLKKAGNKVQRAEAGRIDTEKKLENTVVKLAATSKELGNKSKSLMRASRDVQTTGSLLSYFRSAAKTMGVHSDYSRRRVENALSSSVDSPSPLSRQTGQEPEGTSGVVDFYSLPGISDGSVVVQESPDFRRQQRSGTTRASPLSVEHKPGQMNEGCEATSVPDGATVGQRDQGSGGSDSEPTLAVSGSTPEIRVSATSEGRPLSEMQHSANLTNPQLDVSLPAPDLREAVRAQVRRRESLVVDRPPNPEPPSSSSSSSTVAIDCEGKPDSPLKCHDTDENSHPISDSADNLDSPLVWVDKNPLGIGASHGNWFTPLLASSPTRPRPRPSTPAGKGNILGASQKINVPGSHTATRKKQRTLNHDQEQVP